MQTKIFMMESSELRELIREELDKFFEMKDCYTIDYSPEWIDSKDVPAYLGVSKKTWQRYRDQRLIPFSQVGRKIKVTKVALDLFLEDYTVGSKNHD